MVCFPAFRRRNFLPSKSRPQSGFALALVVIILALVVVMATFFLATASRERRAVAIHEASAKNQVFTDAAVNLVVGAINAATGEGMETGAPRSWTSQPGLLRTFAPGGPSRIYKLYSWDDPIVNASGYDPLAASNRPPSNWKDQPAVFTDLNFPNDTGIFPILDPGALGRVDGFFYNGSTSPVQEIPMPVKWIYILADGSRVVPTSGTTTVSLPGCSAANPVVGRIAYWTDDETSKVNLNTASEGSFWDWPKAATQDEMQYSANPPLAGEYHRLPGHPALTSLSAVFPDWSPGNRWSGVTNYRQRLRAILELSPRYRWSDQSSRGGTYPIETRTYSYTPPTGFLTSNPPPTQAVPPGTNRLYASPSELIFDSSRQLRPMVPPAEIAPRGFFLTTSSKAPETTLFETPRVSLWPVTWPWRSHYFSERGGSPPGSLNPNTTSLALNPWMAPQERLLAFGSSLNHAANQSATDANEHRYFFQRQNPDSATHDWDQILRNRQLLDYLRNLSALPLPGYSGNLQSQLGGAANRDAVLANILNNTRSLVNQYTLTKTSATGNNLLYSFTPVSFRGLGTTTGNYRESNAFRAVPLRITVGGTPIQTVGTYPVLREATLLFIATERQEPERIATTDPLFRPAIGGENPYWNPFNWRNLINVNQTADGPASADYPAALGGTGARTTQMQAILLLTFANDGTHSSRWGADVWLRTTGGSFSVNGSPIGLPKNAAAQGIATQYRGGIADFQGSPVLRPLYQTNNTPKEFRNDSESADVWNLVSDPIPVSANATNFTFAGSSITVEVFPRGENINTSSVGGSPMAVYTLDFSQWNGTYPVPLAPRWVIGDRVTERPNHRQGTGGTSGFGDVEDYKTRYAPANPAVPPTAWALTEIAPSIATSQFQDPAIDNARRPNFAAYAYRGRSDAYRISTSFRNRLWLADNRTGGGQPWGSDAYPFTEGSTGSDTTNRLLSVAWERSIAVIGPYDVAFSLVVDPSSAGNGDFRLGHPPTFGRIDQVFTGSSPRRLVQSTAEAPIPTAGWQHHFIPAGIMNAWATGYPVTAAPQLLGTGVRASVEDPTPVQNPHRGMGRYGRGNAGASGDPTGGNMGNPGTDTTYVMAMGVTTGADATRDFNRATLGDWNSAPGNSPDGGFFLRPDQDFQAMHKDRISDWVNMPYFLMFGSDDQAALGSFSPNRQIASPITLLGGIPASTTQGWMTLLFSPNPSIGSSHPGLSGVRHHPWLDLFWMPVAEPYPISEQFATAGKINLNHQILPFPEIERKTGLHALLQATEIVAFSDNLAAIYKSQNLANAPEYRSRYPIDIRETLDLFDTEIFNSGDVFRSASQLCEMWLVPEGWTAGNVGTFWNGKLLTSDTARETPYDHLYSRVTTKSNTYTVHWKVQALKQTPVSAAAGQWNEQRDAVLSELEGATIIERYLDPNATDIPDYAADPSKILTEPLTKFYKWRTVSNTLFRR